MISNIAALSQYTKNVSFGSRRKHNEETVTITKSKYLMLTAALAALTTGGCSHNNRPWDCEDSFEYSSSPIEKITYTVERTPEGNVIVLDSDGYDVDDLSIVPSHIRQKAEAMEANIDEE